MTGKMLLSRWPARSFTAWLLALSLIAFTGMGCTTFEPKQYGVAIVNRTDNDYKDLSIQLRGNKIGFLDLDIPALPARSSMSVYPLTGWYGAEGAFTWHDKDGNKRSQPVSAGVRRGESKTYFTVFELKEDHLTQLELEEGKVPAFLGKEMPRGKYDSFFDLTDVPPRLSPSVP